MPATKVTFLLATFNQAPFVADAVRAALAQDYEDLEILISDDCSRDATFELAADVVRAYSGPHSVVMNRNQVNLGIGAHINRAMELSSGALIVGAAGDDLSLPSRVSKLVRAWNHADQRPDSLYSPVIVMTPEGLDTRIDTIRSHNQWNDAPFVVRRGGCVLGASHAWTRRVFERFGPLRPDLVQEDHAIPLRSCLMGGVHLVPEPLVRYRSGNSGWGRRKPPVARTSAYRNWMDLCYDYAERCAKQALDDTRTIGSAELERLALVRLEECALMRDLCKSPAINPRRYLRAIRGGVSGSRLARVAWEAWLPGYSSLSSVSRAIRRQ